MCKRAWVWRDMVAFFPLDSLARVKSIAVDAFLRERPEEAMYCPRPGCNHVLPLPPVSARAASAEDERRAGGLRVSCECCPASYCLTCSKQSGKPMPCHPNFSCKDAQLASDEDVQRHRMHIVSEILTLKCPRCKTAFQEYDGCPAVTCDKCGCGFCAKCFLDCGNDAHQHANSCDGPLLREVPRVQKGLCLRQDEFHRLNLQVQQHRVREYLNKMPPKLRQAVLEACRVDFRGRPGGDLIVA